MWWLLPEAVGGHATGRVWPALVSISAPGTGNGATSRENTKLKRLIPETFSARFFKERGKKMKPVI
jgi:hypothetical protein